jgi:hypothetical protein
LFMPPNGFATYYQKYHYRSGMQFRHCIYELVGYLCVHRISLVLTLALFFQHVVYTVQSNHEEW